MCFKGVIDFDFLFILKILFLEYLIDFYFEGWDVEVEWCDVLFGGLQQRVVMVRLFYYCFKYVILDECISLVMFDMEKVMYDNVKVLGIMFMMVSYWRSLWKYYMYILQFDGQGYFVFMRLDVDKRMKLEDEKEDLEVLLRQVFELERRVRELSEFQWDGGNDFFLKKK